MNEPVWVVMYFGNIQHNHGWFDSEEKCEEKCKELSKKSENNSSHWRAFPIYKNN